MELYSTFICLMALWVPLFLLLVLGGQCQNQINSQSFEQGYGEICEAEKNCRTSNLLTCQDGICQCTHPSDMIYDPLSGTCLSLAGKHCGELDKPEGDWVITVTVNCVEDALCDSNGICVCMDNFFESSQTDAGPKGLCIRKKSFGEMCNSSLECESSYSKPLICENGFCKCDPKIQIYDSERRQCVVMVGGDCNLGNSMFVNECTEHADCAKNGNGKCTCQSGYSISSTGSCGLGYGQQCDGIDFKCGDRYFTCLNGRCECKYPLHQYYDEKSGECLSLMSGPCSLNDDSQKCTKNSHCVDRGFYSECDCMEGFVQTRKGGCAPGYGQKCVVGEDECDTITPLYCRNGRCECEDHLLIWNDNLKICVGLVGSRCSINETDTRQCVEFSSCVQSNGIEVDGKCLCDKYSLEVENRTCIYEV